MNETNKGPQVGFSGFWRSVVLWLETNVSEVRAASIFRVNITRCGSFWGLHPRAALPSETFCVLNPEDLGLKHHLHESLKTCIQFYCERNFAMLFSLDTWNL